MLLQGASYSNPAARAAELSSEEIAELLAVERREVADAPEIVELALTLLVQIGARKKLE